MAVMEDDMYEHIMDIIAEKRAEWTFDDDDLHFYVTQPGGFWTNEFGQDVCDSAKCLARSHVKKCCSLFNWPTSKQFMYSAHSERGANELAREWARQGSFFFQCWVDSVGREAFNVEEGSTITYEDNLEFVSWAAEVPDDAHTFDCIILVRHAWPTKKKKASALA